MLNRYNEIMQQIEQLKAEAQQIAVELEADVKKSGTIAGHGWQAYFKPGGNTINHEAAAKKQIDNTRYHELYKEYTTATAKTPLSVVPLSKLVEIVGEKNVTTSTAWAKITKAAKCNLEAYTTQSAETFVIERI